MGCSWVEGWCVNGWGGKGYTILSSVAGGKSISCNAACSWAVGCLHLCNQIILTPLQYVHMYLDPLGNMNAIETGYNAPNSILPRILCKHKQHTCGLFWPDHLLMKSWHSLSLIIQHLSSSSLPPFPPLWPFLAMVRAFFHLNHLPDASEKEGAEEGIGDPESEGEGGNVEYSGNRSL